MNFYFHRNLFQNDKLGTWLDVVKELIWPIVFLPCDQRLIQMLYLRKMTNQALHVMFFEKLFVTGISHLNLSPIMIQIVLNSRNQFSLWINNAYFYEINFLHKYAKCLFHKWYLNLFYLLFSKANDDEVFYNVFTFLGGGKIKGFALQQKQNCVLLFSWLAGHVSDTRVILNQLDSV